MLVKCRFLDVALRGKRGAGLTALLSPPVSWSGKPLPYSVKDALQGLEGEGTLPCPLVKSPLSTMFIVAPTQGHKHKRKRAHCGPVYTECSHLRR